MATSFKHCSVEHCNKNAHYSAHGAMGMCGAHYQRWKKYGDPLAGGTSPGEPTRWLEGHVDYSGDECLMWPFSRYPDGYGQVRFQGNSTNASRIMCLLAHGVPPLKSMEAAHSCGKGHLGCVNPRHLRWDTPKGNCADRAGHGTENRGESQWMAKLSSEDVLEIRSRAGLMLHRELARMYGVSRMTITDIVNRRTWAWLK